MLSAACILDSRCICIANDQDYHYRQRNESIVHGDARAYAEEITDFYLMLRQIVDDKKYPELRRKAAAKVVYRIYRAMRSFPLVLTPELEKLVRAQCEEDGGEAWSAMLNEVKTHYRL